jgi:predicted RNA binding protein YcfA (HicA-like mRNA interferase family)
MKKKTNDTLKTIGIGIGIFSAFIGLRLLYLDEKFAYEIAENGGYFRTESQANDFILTQKQSRELSRFREQYEKEAYTQPHTIQNVRKLKNRQLTYNRRLEDLKKKRAKHLEKYHQLEWKMSRESIQYSYLLGPERISSRLDEKMVFKSYLSKIFGLHQPSLFHFFAYSNDVLTEEEEASIAEDETRLTIAQEKLHKSDFKVDVTDTETEPLLHVSRGDSVELQPHERKAKRWHMMTGGGGGEGLVRQEAPLGKNQGEKEPYPILNRDAAQLYKKFKEKSFQNIRFREVRRFFELEGFQIRSIRGSHYIMKKGPYSAVIPFRSQEVARGTLINIFRKIGLQ